MSVLNLPIKYNYQFIFATFNCIFLFIKLENILNVLESEKLGKLY